MKILKIPTMSCEHCVKRIAECLTENEIAYEIDLDQKLVRIDGCDNCVAKALTALADIGYEAILET